MARILLVEDDETFGPLLAKACKGWGHESVLVRNGAEALREVAGYGEEYDLIICDLQLPRMPGKVFLQRVASLIRDEIPVIVLSAERHLIDSLGEVRSWLFQVVEKGCDMSVLNSLIERALEKRRSNLETKREDERVFRLERKIEHLLSLAELLYEKSSHDPMTKLPTRAKLEEEFPGHIAPGGSFDGRFVLALCDMDDFRRMNHQWGYEGGDKAIKRCATLMGDALRKGDRLYRYGGDEFVLLVKAGSLSEGARAVERIRKHVALAPGAVMEGLKLPPMTFSAGLVHSTTMLHPTLPGLLQEATVALKRAKEEGGNCLWPPPQEEDEDQADPLSSCA